MKLFVLFILMSSLSCVASAQSETSKPESSQSKLKLEEQDSSKKSDIDSEITNNYLRAKSGKKSNYSMYSELYYAGGSIEKPFGKERPLLMPGALTETKTKISGTVSLKFRIDPYSSINVGTGVGLTTPGYAGQESQVENPTGSYSYVFRAGEFQNISSLGMTYYTSKEIRKRSHGINDLYFGHTILGTVGTTRLSYGFAGVMDYAMYSQDYFLSDNDPKNFDTKDNGGRQDWTFAIYPFLDYSISDRLSIRTSYSGLMYYHYRGDTSPTYYGVDPTQSLGLGVAVTREIYLLPNINWIWSDMRAEKTNVALSANISL